LRGEGEGGGERIKGHNKAITPHPSPLPQGERGNKYSIPKKEKGGSYG